MTALAFVLTLGPVERFPRSKQVVSYLGLNPSEFRIEAAQALQKIDPDWAAHFLPRSGTRSPANILVAHLNAPAAAETLSPDQSAAPPAGAPGTSSGGSAKSATLTPPETLPAGSETGFGETRTQDN